MIKKYISSLISLGLFLGGIVILVLRIPVWSLVFGLPSVQIGFILVLFSYDSLTQKIVEEDIGNIRKIPCTICGYPTYTRGSEKEGICSHCDKKLIEMINQIKPLIPDL